MPNRCLPTKKILHAKDTLLSGMSLSIFFFFGSSSLLVLSLNGIVGCTNYDFDRVSFLELSNTAVSNVTTVSATVTSELINLVKGDPVTEHGHVWSNENERPTLADQVDFLGPRSSGGLFVSELNNLTFNTPVYVRAFAVKGDQVIFGPVISFDVRPANFMLSMDSIVRISNVGTAVYSSVQGVPDGLEITSIGHVWGTERAEPVIELDNFMSEGDIRSREAVITSVLTDLEPLTTYTVRAFIVVDGKTVYSDSTLSFTERDVWIFKQNTPPIEVMRGIPDLLSVIDNGVFLSYGQDRGIYSPDNNTWVAKTGPPLVRGAGYFTADGFLYYGFGKQSGGEYSTDLYIYSPIEDIYIDLYASLPALSRNAALGFLVGDKGYIGFGSDPNGQLLTDFVVVDLNNFELTPGPAFPRMGRSSPKSTVVFELEETVCMGLTLFRQNRDFWCLNFESNPEGDWIRASDFPLGIALFLPAAWFTIGNSGYVYIPERTNNFWEYNFDQDRWIRRMDLPAGLVKNPLAFEYLGNGYLGFGKENSGESDGSGLWQYIPLQN